MSAPNVHPDDFGRLGVGEGFILLGRETARVQIITNPRDDQAAAQVAEHLEVLAAATDGPLRAQAWRMAAVARELAPPVPGGLPTPDRRALPAQGGGRAWSGSGGCRWSGPCECHRSARSSSLA